MEQYDGHTSVQSSASNFGGAVGIQQLPNDANSQLLEQIKQSICNNGQPTVCKYNC